MTAHTIMFIPTSPNVFPEVATKNLKNLFVQKNIRAALFPEFNLNTIEQFLAENKLDYLLESIIKQREEIAATSGVLLVPGIALSKPYAAELNLSIATALGAAIIFVANIEKDPQILLQQLKIIANPYQYRYPKTILGLITESSDNQLLTAIAKLDLKISLLGSLDNNINFSFLEKFLSTAVNQPITPPIFKYRLIEKARAANKIIVLPEGDEPRTIAAANVCAERGIARCILLQEKNKIEDSCKKFNLKLHEKVQIIEPQSVVEKYVAPLYELRRSKGLTVDGARKQLEDRAVLGTMMLHFNEVDGLVSGAVNTTANTVRPALQIIKTPPHVKLVSSVFFMCLPDQVLVYGDCAVNPNPGPEELADIAIQSACSAIAFGITPKIAMLSYSTGTSGTGPSVDRVRAATEIVKKLRPDLEVDGPMQYDAAISEETGRQKAPHSKVAGHATVFVVPNLDVGNIMYKAVQRGTGIVCIGPMLQGLRKPVNDLSRGCFSEDIVFTIAVTAIQATQST